MATNDKHDTTSIVDKVEEKAGTDGKRKNAANSTGDKNEGLLFSISLALYDSKPVAARDDVGEAQVADSTPNTPQASSQDKSLASSDSDLVMVDDEDDE